MCVLELPSEDFHSASGTLILDRSHNVHSEHTFRGGVSPARVGGRALVFLEIEMGPENIPAGLMHATGASWTPRGAIESLVKLKWVPRHPHERFRGGARTRVGGTKRMVLRNTHKTTEISRLLRTTIGLMHGTSTSWGAGCRPKSKSQNK